ncbi:pyridoxal phosphate-dependent aminotransferase [Paenibacillus cellulositrophicus]|uniref:MalY/PatB family protein n=1 Tax=Paenibacillus cellulositrophicus TaxID=562959 RepID=UPI002041C397|nr:MalY/PatB family protein [Paenibacillus cellulositrophicus]MCM3001750.1 pyridoxal phosphate-dependent aminotransferase [Paenibacillus cellulositrophicus]
MNFHQPIERINTDSFKWDDLKRIFGVSDVLPMWVADMDFAAPDSVISALNSRVEHGVFGYTMQSDAYNQAVAHWMKSRHRWSIDKEWIVFCPGVVPALSFIVQAFTEPGDKVAIQTPVYPPFYSVVTDHGRELVQNPLKEQDGYYTMDLEALEQSLDDQVKLFILCSPHNPVGRVWRREELEAVAKLCMERGILMVSDEIHADLVYEEGTHIPFASLSEEIQENCIICTAPSKTFNIAGLNTSNIIIPNDSIRRRFKKTLELYHVNSISTLGSAATQAAYNDGKAWLDEALVYMKANMEYVSQYLGEHIPEIKTRVPEATYLMWLDFRALQMSPDDLEQFLLNKAKLALNKGSAFGKEGEGFMRLNIACSRSLVEEAMKRLDQAVQEWRKEQQQQQQQPV